MTTHSHVRAGAKKVRPWWRTMMWAVLATAGAVFCAVTVVGRFTFADGTGWLTFFWACVGIVGFSGMAIQLWRQVVND